MSKVTQAAKRILTRIELFSRAVLKMPLRNYQLRPLQAIINSVLRREGREFLLIFPRQSGKNEAVAHLLVYLLNLLQRVGGNIVYGATGDGLGRGIHRLEARLDNPWNKGKWDKGGSPLRRTLGRAAVVFLSTHPQASARGETAHWLLVIDELQDLDRSHLEAVFEPMRAANNASALYIGTTRLTTDALWRKRRELEAEEARDGIQRVFLIEPDQVIAENPAYGRFLDEKIRKLGRDHPVIASEYFLRPIDGEGRLFPPRRQALMVGHHSRQRTPHPGKQTIIAAIDVGGQDEAATDPVARLDNPARDYTVATIFEVSAGEEAASLPGYHVLDVFVDHGSRHFQDVPGKPSLVKRLVAWLEQWRAAHIIIDRSGVGEGIYDWLCAAFGRHRVTGYDFQRPGQKAKLGSAFLSLVETGRFRYWSDDSGPLSDAWWFWRQVEACTYELPPGGRFDRHLRWGVPAGATIDTPTGRQPVHDDRLLSAALIAEADRLRLKGNLRTGQAKSAVVRPQDPFQDMRF